MRPDATLFKARGASAPSHDSSRLSAPAISSAAVPVAFGTAIPTCKCRSCWHTWAATNSCKTQCAQGEAVMLGNLPRRLPHSLKANGSTVVVYLPRCRPAETHRTRTAVCW